MFCGNCKNLSVASNGDYVCQTSSGTYIVLKRKDYADDKEFREALLEKGNDCKTWVFQKTKEVLQKKPEAPQQQGPEPKLISRRDGLGWIFASFFLGIIIFLLFRG